MSTVDEIKDAAARLTLDEQFEVFRWWTTTEGFRRHQIEALKNEIAIGIEQAERGEVAPLDIEAIKAEGRRRLAEKRPV